MRIEISDKFLAKLNACWKRHNTPELKTEEEWVECFTVIMELSMLESFGYKWKREKA